jgi:hypothetical protein
MTAILPNDGDIGAGRQFCAAVGHWQGLAEKLNHYDAAYFPKQFCLSASGAAPRE